MWGISLAVCFVFSLCTALAEPLTCNRPNEIAACVHSCPPERTCSNREIKFRCHIEGECQEKCVCKEGYFRNPLGDCISGDECEIVLLLSEISQRVERAVYNKPLRCNRPNEIAACVHPCPPERTCRNRGIKFSCLNRGEREMKCVCKEGYFRNALGDCITGTECDMCPGENEFFSCGPECDNVCSELHIQNRTNCPIVNIVCNRKCYCEDGFARDENKKCIPIEKCPSKISPRVERKVYNEPKCGRNEEYVSCKRTCPPETCISLVARFKCNANEPCRPRCACRDGFLRPRTGEPCEPMRQCPELAHSPDFNK